jgi:hypothetical protein
MVELLECIVHVSVLLGAIFVIYQFCQSQELTRIERTLSYVEKFSESGGNVDIARTKVRSFLWENAENIEEIKKLPKESRPEMYGRFLLQTIQNDTQYQGGIAEHLDEIVRFVGELWICADQNLCDRDSLSEYFSEYAARFQRNFGPYLAVKQKRAKNFGATLSKVASMSPSKKSWLSRTFPCFLGCSD